MLPFWSGSFQADYTPERFLFVIAKSASFAGTIFYLNKFYKANGTWNINFKTESAASNFLKAGAVATLYLVIVAYDSQYSIKYIQQKTIKYIIVILLKNTIL